MKSMGSRAARLRLNQFLPYLITVLAARVSAELATRYEKRFGISIPEWRVIAHLAENKAVSVREIHQRLNMDKSKVSRAVERLARAGLLAKRIRPDDRRLLELSLTSRGRRVFARIVPLALDYQNDLLRTLTKRERTEFEAFVWRLINRSGLIVKKSAPPHMSLRRPRRSRLT
jgi:DNA-binding MarR family transcriptional regulator